MLASPRPGFIGKLAKPAAEATAPLLAAMTRLGEVVRDQELAVKAALLEEALEPADARDLLPLAARAAAFGVDFSQPARLVVIRAAAATSPACGASWSRALEHARIPHLRAAARRLARGARAGRRRGDRRRARGARGRATGRRDRRRPRGRRRSRRPPLAARRRARRRAAATAAARSCASRTSTSARSWSARSRPSGSRRRWRRSSPCCAPTRRCTRRSAPYFAHDLDIAATARVAAHAPQLAALPARAARAAARPLAQAAGDDRRALHRAGAESAGTSAECRTRRP